MEKLKDLMSHSVEPHNLYYKKPPNIAEKMAKMLAAIKEQIEKEEQMKLEEMKIVKCKY
jgi:hypothetical protein